MNTLMWALPVDSTMEWAPWFDGPRCRDCATVAPRDAIECPDCGGTVSAIQSIAFDDGWGDVGLPVHPSDSRGPTPLVGSEWFASESDMASILIKDEGQNPTGHWTDRGMRVAADVAVDVERESIGLVSPGQTGVAAAAAAASRDITASVYVPSRTPFPAKAMINVHGGAMTVVGGRFPDAAAAYAGADDVQDTWSVDPMENPYVRSGMGSLYLELLDANAGNPPDAIVLPTASGAAVIAIADIAIACHQADVTSSVPRLIAAQPAGCAPIVEAYAADRLRPTSVEQPDTICGELEIPDPTGGEEALSAIRETGGEAIAVPDSASLEATVRLADRTGLSASVAGGVAAAAATDLSVTDPTDTVVVVNPGAGGLDADILRSHLMGQGI